MMTSFMSSDVTKMGMMAANRLKQMSFESAMEMLDNPYSCLEKIESQRRFPLPMSCVNRIYQGVCKLMEEELGRYSDELGGIVTAFDNVKIINPYASIMEDIPYILVDVRMDLIVFKPNVGSTLTGKVTKTGSYHVSCLVHGCFNVSLVKSNEYGLYNRVKRGDTVVLEVNSVQVHSRIIQIEGKLLHIMDESPIENGSSLNEVGAKEETVASDDDSLATIELKDYKDRRKAEAEEIIEVQSTVDTKETTPDSTSGCEIPRKKVKKHKKEKKKKRSKEKTKKDEGSKSKKHKKHKKEKT